MYVDTTVREDTLKNRNNQSNDTKKGLTVKRGYVETTVRISGGVSNKRQKRD